MTCKNCGAEIVEGTKFCTNCGSSIPEETPVETPVGATFEKVEAEVVNDTTSYSAGSSNQSTTSSYEYSSKQTPVADTTTPGFAIASLVLGILSLLCCCCGIFSVVLGILAVVFGILSMKKTSNGKGMAIAGIVCGGVGILGAVVLMILSAVGTAIPGIDNINEYNIQDIIDNL